MIYIFQTIIISLAALVRAIILEVRKYHRQGVNIRHISRADRFGLNYACVVVISLLFHCINAILLDAEYGPGRCFRLPKTGGSRWKESGKLLDPTENYRNNNLKMEAVFRSYVLRFFPVTSSPFPAKNSLENGRKS